MEERSPIMVLVTLQRLCARLIRSGGDMAIKQHCPLKVVHVAPKAAAQGIGDAAVSAQVLDYLYALANEAGAEMCVLVSEDMPRAVADYAQQNGVQHIILGEGEHAPRIVTNLKQLLPDVEIEVMAEDVE